MKIFKLSLRTISPLLVGGVTFDPVFDAVSAIRDDKYIIPASVIKGALRIEFEKFLTLIGEKVDIKWEDEPYKSTRENGGNPIISSLFGGDGHEGALRFNDLTSAEKVKEKPMIPRPQVTISRRLGTAVPQKLFFRKFVPPDVNFEGKIEVRHQLPDDTLKVWNSFCKYIQQVDLSIGNSKTYGMGKVKLNISESSLSHRHIAPENAFSGEWKLFKVEIKLEEPLNLGYRRFRYILPTLRFIPGSTIRGAIAYALLNIGINGQDIANYFLNNQKLLRFSNFYYKSNTPLLNTLKKEKGGGDRPPKDLLLHEFLLLKHLNNTGELHKELYEWVNGTEINPFVPIDSPDPQGFKLQLFTRLTVDRDTGAAFHGRLYTIEAIMPDNAKFLGIIYMPENLQKLLRDLQLLIGGRKSKGFGKARITITSPFDLLNFENKTETLNRKLQNLAEDYNINIPKDRVYFTIDFVSDVVLPQSPLDTYINTTFKEISDFRIEHAWVTRDSRGGFDQLNSSVHPTFKNRIPLYKRGSVILLSVSKEEWNKTAQTLKKLIINGFGKKTHEGFGFIAVSLHEI